jgi:DNA-directed RNA polymerase specialized sigma24 family protein
LTPDQLDAISNEFDRLIPGRGDVIGETLAALRQCLTTLSAAQRDVVRRAYEQKQTCRAIADQLGHSIEAVKKRLQRARAQLRDCILGKLKMEQAHG